MGGIDLVHRRLDLGIRLDIGYQGLVNSVTIGFHHIVEALFDGYRNVRLLEERVKEGLDDGMKTYGYAIDQALVTDIEPDAKVKAAMNEINAAQREQVAANARGEAEKILKVKQAEAEAESKALQGQGIANQRKAIIEGLKQSVEAFSAAVEGTTPKDVMMLVLVTQYLDTLKEIGASDRSNTIFISHSPAAIGDLFRQMQEAVMIGQKGATVSQ